MSLAIYRKYRPQSWSDLTGQNHIKVTLQNEIETGKVSHAYLLTGPRGIGKTTTARLLAKAVNCLERKEGESEPCNKCESCLEQVKNNDLDILEIDAASHTGVDNVRENIIANARFSPVKRKYKVFIIDEVHMLSISAFNALLKILEEPPAHAIFILATTEIHKVPATIISRCQRFDFKKIIADDLIKRLTMIATQEGVKINKKVLADIARVSEGCLRDAESLLGQVLSLGEKDIDQEKASLIIPQTNYAMIIELIAHLVYKSSAKSVTLINHLVDEGVDLNQFCAELIETLRKMMLSKISGGLQDFAFDLDQEMEKKIIDLSLKFEISQIILLINLFSAKKAEIKTAVVPQLPLEIAVIEYCSNKGHKELSVSAEASTDKKEPGGKEGKKEDGDDDSGGSDSFASNPPEKEEKGEAFAVASNGGWVDKKEDKNNESGVDKATLKKSEIPVNPDQQKKTNLKLAEIREQWHEFIIKMQDQNASLVFILKVAEPVDLSGNVLQIGLKYSFHQQRLNQAKIKETLEQGIKNFWGEELVVNTCLLDKDYQSDFIKKQTEDDEVELVDDISTGDNEQQALIDNLVKTFDGKVVE